MNKLFQVHMLNENGKKHATRIAAIFEVALEQLELICPDGREMSLVKTKLEEAAFFAKKAMACQLENQQ